MRGQAARTLRKDRDMATVVTRFVDKRARAGECTELTIQIPPLSERSSNVLFLAHR